MIPLSVAKAPSSCNGYIEFDEPIADESGRDELTAIPAARHAAPVPPEGKTNQRRSGRRESCPVRPPKKAAGAKPFADDRPNAQSRRNAWLPRSHPRM